MNAMAENNNMKYFFLAEYCAFMMYGPIRFPQPKKTIALKDVFMKNGADQLFRIISEQNNSNMKTDRKIRLGNFDKAVYSIVVMNSAGINHNGTFTLR